MANSKLKVTGAKLHNMARKGMKPSAPTNMGELMAKASSATCPGCGATMSGGDCPNCK